MTEQPNANQLLVAIERMLHWGALAIHQNQGGAWFYDPAPTPRGTRRLDALEIQSLYEKEAKERGI